LNTHSSLAEGIVGDLGLTTEQTEAITELQNEDRRKRKRDSYHTDPEHKKTIRLRDDKIRADPELLANRQQVKKASKSRIRKEKRHYCEICKVSKTSARDLEDHLKTPRHLKKLEESISGPKKKRTIWYCELCNVDRSPRSFGLDATANPPSTRRLVSRDKYYCFSLFFVDRNNFCDTISAVRVSRFRRQLFSFSQPCDYVLKEVGKRI
jgi:hypothetical protein